VFGPLAGAGLGLQQEKDPMSDPRNIATMLSILALGQGIQAGPAGTLTAAPAPVGPLLQTMSGAQQARAQRFERAQKRDAEERRFKQKDRELELREDEASEKALRWLEEQGTKQKQFKTKEARMGRGMDLREREINLREEDLEEGRVTREREFGLKEEREARYRAQAQADLIDKASKSRNPNLYAGPLAAVGIEALPEHVRPASLPKLQRHRGRFTNPAYDRVVENYNNIIDSNPQITMEDRDTVMREAIQMMQQDPGLPAMSAEMRKKLLEALSNDKKAPESMLRK